ncbi:MAG: N-acetylneuraminate synthase family protein [Alphaproteobacteria bacterium]|nr:N-acetylneuraminate synthase family protein [Alphaproteobacteria bacterium]MBF0332464.1 N-acetylneuraminate synthase family protein [Alphaproteobacteria bacterium]
MTRTHIIAEMAWSHDGSPELAAAITRAAAAAGADALSIHVTHMPDYMVPHYGTGPGRVSAGKETRPIFDYLSDIALSFEDWTNIARLAREVGLDLVVMPNDTASLRFAETLAPSAWVLSAACFEEAEFIEEVGRLGRPVHLRVGGATLGEIDTVIGLLRGAGTADITLLYGHQNYPTAIEDTGLMLLAGLRDAFGLPVGLADHIDASDDAAMVLPLLALPLGAVRIEKHITHDRAKRGEDFESALDPAEFRLFVERVRKAERALGSPLLTGLGGNSAAYRANSRKRLVAARDIAAGEVILSGMLAAKRSDEGAPASDKPRLVGGRARVAIGKDRGVDLASVTREG